MSIIHYGYHGDVHQLRQVWDPILYAQFQWIFPRFQQKETVEHLEGLVIGTGALGLGRNSAEKTYHDLEDLEDENGISLIFINTS